MRVPHTIAGRRLGCCAAAVALLLSAAGCQPADETPKSSDYYTGPMKGKKLTGKGDTAAPEGAAAPAAK